MWDGYSLADLQQITGAILSHSAAPEVRAIYHQATSMTLAAIVACQVGNLFACLRNGYRLFDCLGRITSYCGLVLELNVRLCSPSSISRR